MRKMTSLCRFISPRFYVPFIVLLFVNLGYSQWAKSVGSSGSDKGFNIVVDASGNVYVVGLFEETVDFDPGAGTTELTSNGGNDIFFAK